MNRLEDLVAQLSIYVGQLLVERSHLTEDHPHYKEICDSIEEVRKNLEWCLAMKPELEDIGAIKPGLTD
ncbi:hypothetical protein CYYG_00011 [Cyanophage SS120-1]|uniref:Uncharacterized protein n=1 Tax=Cyanophage SS120-1 TaxID=616674 RepID=M1U3A3_9CAUD|nr:hypothetical protein CYYG_00011 [Cyanophage SS120-1]AGG54513.1 hypothetical protein CYYG_00011 [Cyanophage SS120-1]